MILQPDKRLSRQIGIVGLGWLGLPLARKLKDRGTPVWGTTTREIRLKEIQGEGIPVERWTLQPKGNANGLIHWLRETEVLVVNIPPGLRGGGSPDFFQRMVSLLEILAPFPEVQLLFVSSTSVFGGRQGSVDERTPPDPDSASGQEILRAEEQLRRGLPRTTILRPGGLLGPDRHPVYSLSGRKSLGGGSEPVNLVHRDDVIAIILWIIDNEYRGETLHAVYPDHPTRSEYYTAEALVRGLPPPEYVSESGGVPGKRVECPLLLARGFEYRQPIRTALYR